MASSARPVALVTGASAGIGAALAREAANDEHDLGLVSRRREPMEALAAELKSTGIEITVIPADLGIGSAAARLMKAYATQVEVLRRLRSGGQQFVRVEHVHVNDGGQAVIGNVKRPEPRA